MWNSPLSTSLLWTRSDNFIIGDELLWTSSWTITVTNLTILDSLTAEVNPGFETIEDELWHLLIYRCGGALAALWASSWRVTFVNFTAVDFAVVDELSS